MGARYGVIVLGVILFAIVAFGIGYAWKRWRQEIEDRPTAEQIADKLIQNTPDYYEWTGDHYAEVRNMLIDAVFRARGEESPD